MHDSGGDRSQTVAALGKFLPRMQAKGYEFTSLTAALGAPARTPRSPDSRSGRARPSSSPWTSRSRSPVCSWSVSRSSAGWSWPVSG
ncbi:hypothetical protein NKH18_19655 [Streptomyces sp. M10(2022)]